MKIARPPHSWTLSPRRAVEIQKQLAAYVRHTRPPGVIRCVAGVDAAFTADGTACVAGVVLWDASSKRIVERRTARRRLRFPYVPGLLSFREAPAVLAALRKLTHEPDALICDGHGLAHPRRFGIACHVGLLVDKPTVGCAKNRLVGEHEEPGTRRGSRRRLTLDGEIIGAVLRTRDHVRPVYVSVGHRIDLASSVRLVLRCAGGFRLPEPTRLADRLVAAAKRSG